MNTRTLDSNGTDYLSYLQDSQTSDINDMLISLKYI